jgi:hypothetical protein
VAISSSVITQIEVKNSQVLGDAIRIGGPRQGDDVALLYEPPKHHLRNAPPVTRGDLRQCRVAKHPADGHRAVGGNRESSPARSGGEKLLAEVRVIFKLVGD